MSIFKDIFVILFP